jgi:hypothetical protein
MGDCAAEFLVRHTPAHRVILIFHIPVQDVIRVR